MVKYAALGLVAGVPISTCIASPAVKVLFVVAGTYVGVMVDEHDELLRALPTQK